MDEVSGNACRRVYKHSSSSCFLWYVAQCTLPASTKKSRWKTELEECHKCPALHGVIKRQISGQILNVMCVFSLTRNLQQVWNSFSMSKSLIHNVISVFALCMYYTERCKLLHKKMSLCSYTTFWILHLAVYTKEFKT